MNDWIAIKRKCEQLSYTIDNSFSREKYENTYSSLEDMFYQYGYANVLGVLSELWSFDVAVNYFENTIQSSYERRSSILTIASYYHRAYNGGVERVNAELMNLWVKMGFKVIFFSDEPENSFDYPYSEMVKRIILPRTDMRLRLNELQQHCLEENVDLFVYHDWTSQNIIWDCMLIKMLKIKFAVYCHGHFAWCFKYGRSYLYQPECFKLCDIVFAISETNAMFYKMCGCKSYLVQNPVPSELVEVKSYTKVDSKRVLLIGRLAPEKYPLDALEIFKEVHDKMPDVVLDIVGDGDLESEMREFVINHKLEDVVFFHGLKMYSELDVYFRNASCVLLTSRMEGYPMVVLETKAYGLPLVMYDMPYLSLLKDNKGVLTAPFGDFKKMAKNLNRVLMDTTFNETLRAEAIESFKRLKEHNHEADWNNIFNLLKNGDFSQQESNKSDNNIIPILLNEIKSGYENEITNNINYKVGVAILKFPRNIWCFLTRLKRRIIK